MVHHLPELVHRYLTAGTIIRILIHPSTDHFRIPASMYRIHDHGHSVIPAAFLHTSHQLPGNFCHILFFKLCQTVGAVSAVIGTVLSKVSENVIPQTFVRRTVKGHFSQTFPLPFLHHTRCLVVHGFGAFHLVDKKLIRDHILPGIQQDALRRQAVTSCPSRLLIVAFNVLRHIVMDHIPDVGFVNSHTKSVCCDHDLFLVVNKLLLVLLALPVAESRMVTGGAVSFSLQTFADFLHRLPGEAIDDAALLFMFLQIIQHSLHLVPGMLDDEFQIFSVKSRGQTYRIPKIQQRQNVLPHFPCRCCRKSADHRAVIQCLDKFMDPQIAWTEILSPLGNTVRLIHTQHRQCNSTHRFLKTFRHQPLRRHIDNLILTSLHIPQSSQILSLSQ